MATDIISALVIALVVIDITVGHKESVVVFV